MLDIADTTKMRQQLIELRDAYLSGKIEEEEWRRRYQELLDGSEPVPVWRYLLRLLPRRTAKAAKVSKTAKAPKQS
ncbi:hypothetical protein [Poseidonocella sp. HB161398]|uniref:hypothetical protein n=1 Tax=Poseidonocella sp. HB161398 TaxID=2320855 RepID=UPI0011080AB0|nr:hypothetical protein [Poseidonocella sp. HB161398]